jgi:hypothetical protein
MSKLHFEHGATDGQYEDAYKKMLMESAAADKAAMEAHCIAHYEQLKAQAASLKAQIERMEENNPVVQKHIGKKVKKLTEAVNNKEKYMKIVNDAIAKVEALEEENPKLLKQLTKKIDKAGQSCLGDAATTACPTTKLYAAADNKTKFLKIAKTIK